MNESQKRIFIRRISPNVTMSRTIYFSVRFGQNKFIITMPIRSHRVSMSRMIALTCFLIQQEKKSIALNEYMDSTLQKMYRMAFQIFTCEISSKIAQDIEIESFCDAAASQLKKVTHNNTLSNEVPWKHIEKYTEDSVSFAEKF
ncbi:hypothetical protein BD560DRAFT_419679 [Blakeslea trispora]|nr:hypothetical protein BD560DRAFT_419679 [Blakeslea trispora]